MLSALLYYTIESISESEGAEGGVELAGGDGGAGGELGIGGEGGGLGAIGGAGETDSFSCFDSLPLFKKKIATATTAIIKTIQIIKFILLKR